MTGRLEPTVMIELCLCFVPGVIPIVILACECFWSMCVGGASLCSEPVGIFVALTETMTFGHRHFCGCLFTGGVSVYCVRLC